MEEGGFPDSATSSVGVPSSSPNISACLGLSNSLQDTLTRLVLKQRLSDSLILGSSHLVSSSCFWRSHRPGASHTCVSPTSATPGSAHCFAARALSHREEEDWQRVPCWSLSQPSVWR
ncbi:uncharacterized protein FYW23_003618 [Sylvia borin]